MAAVEDVVESEGDALVVGVVGLVDGVVVLDGVAVELRAGAVMVVHEAWLAWLVGNGYVSRDVDGAAGREHEEVPEEQLAPAVTRGKGKGS
jgi:hypothetical protein